MKPLTNIPSYTDPVLEEQMRDFETGLAVHATEHGRADALRSQPASLSDFNHLIGRHIHARTQAFIHACAGKLQTLSGMTTAKQIDQQCASQSAPLSAHLTETDIAIKSAESEMKRLQPCRAEQIRRALVYAGLSFMSAAEGVMSYSAFRYANIPKYPAIIAAGGVGVSIFLGCEYFARWIKKAETAKGRMLRYAMVIAAFSAGFFALARMRTQAYEKAAAGFNSLPAQHPCSCAAVALCIVSVLLFVVGLVSAVKTCRSKEQVRRLDAFRQVREELQDLQAKREGLAKDIQSLGRQAAEELLLSKQKHEYALALYHRCTACANGAVEKYITTNVRSRSGSVPSFFDSVPEMRFTVFPNPQTEQA